MLDRLAWSGIECVRSLMTVLSADCDVFVKCLSLLAATLFVVQCMRGLSRCDAIARANDPHYLYKRADIARAHSLALPSSPQGRTSHRRVSARKGMLSWATHTVKAFYRIPLKVQPRGFAELCNPAGYRRCWR